MMFKALVQLAGRLEAVSPDGMRKIKAEFREGLISLYQIEKTEQRARLFQILTES